MPLNEFLTRLPVWFALAGYGGGLFLLLTRQDRPARLVWSMGCVCLILHVFCAYQFYHRWNQTEVLHEVARQTESVVGWNWSGGLYVNYLFMLVWSADVLWWWRGLGQYRRRSALASGLIHGFLAFIVFNATVVFKSGPLRIVGLIATLVLLALRLRRRPKQCSAAS